MIFLMLLFSDNHKAQEGRPSFLFGPIYDESTTPIERKAIQSMMRQYTFVHFAGFLEFWNLIGVRFARGYFSIPLKPGRLSFMTIPPHWLSLDDLHRRGDKSTPTPGIQLIVDTRIFAQVKKVADSLQEAIDSLHLDGISPQKIMDNLQAKRYTFHLSGEYWVIRFQGDTFRIRDSKGLRLVALLLKYSDVEYSAVKLVYIFEKHSEGMSEKHFEEGHISKIDSLRDAGPVADKQAINEYRREIKELDEEIEESKHNNDVERIQQLETEREKIYEAIRSAHGLGIFERKALSTDELARVSITMAIKSAIKKIGNHDPDLSIYLQQTIRTGTICIYCHSTSNQINWIF